MWFSESNAEEVILRQLDRMNDEGLLRRTPDPATGRPASRFLDLGTGNGHMLFRLNGDDSGESQWLGKMIGVDYSEGSIQLARRVAQANESDHTIGRQLQFDCWNLLCDAPGSWLADGFDVVLDKGTFDAISLMNHDPSSQHPCEIYRDRVTRLLKPGCFLIITSCNWTRDELIDWLVIDGGGLAFLDEAKYPKFTFGGQTGQSVVTLTFQRKVA